MNQTFHQKGWRYVLSHAFRSQSFLWKFALGVILAGIAAGYIGGIIQPPGTDKLGERVLALSGISLREEDDAQVSDPSKPQDIAPTFAEEVSRPGVDFSDVVWAVPTLAPHTSPAARENIREVLRHRFGSENADLVFDYIAAWNRADSEALARMKARADRPDAPRFANYVTGRIEMRRENFQTAFVHFNKEGEHDDAGESRHMAVQALLEAKNFTGLAALTADPRYAKHVSAYVSLQLAIGQRDWLGILRASPLAQLASYRADLVIVTVIAGLGWAFFLAHLGEWPGLFSKTSLLCFFALVAGALSTVPTLYLVIAENDILHFTAGTDPAHIFAYNIAGVGLREELCKLFFFLPFLPILLRRDNELEALIVASFIGLGFAIEENCGYFATSAATSGPGRFLTANFFHIMLTGINGLVLFRAFARGTSGLNDFLYIFPVTVLAHGAYDALLALPKAEGYGYFGTAVYVVFAVYYFKRVHPLRSNSRMTLGLTGAFVSSCSVMAAAVIAFVMIDLGPAAGLAAIVPELLSTAVLMFMFFREFDEKLTV